MVQEQVSAFRAKEKLYQLHREQQMKYSKGRLRGGKLRTLDTDFSGVIDLHVQPSHPAAVQHRTPPSCSSSSSSDSGSSGSPKSTWMPEESSSAAEAPSSPCSPTAAAALAGSSCSAYTFPGRPGLVYFPAALPPQLQLQLMQAALQEWPQPLAHSNHTKTHGPLPDLWEAAQAGLLLAEGSSSPGVSSQGQGLDDAGPCSSCGCPDEAERAASCSGQDQEQVLLHQGADRSLKQQKQQQQQPGASCREEPSKAAPKACARKQRQQAGGMGQREQAMGTQQQEQHSKQEQQEGQQKQVHTCWSSSGAGPSAAKLLQKLRWVTLGPPYDWTARAYNTQAPHRPLPPGLQTAATLFAGTAASLCPGLGAAAAVAAAAAAQEASAPASSSSSSDVSSDGCRCSSSGGVGGGGVSTNDSSYSTPGSSSSSSRYRPDAAIVNYYREGDTLGGHIDDVEPHMDLPIVSISLGCPAVFLIGGESREEEPMALMLRSGDVVVLAGQARRCYHGVPRVLAEQGLPAAVEAAAAAAAGGSGADLQRVCGYMRSARVNISIRDIN